MKYTEQLRNFINTNLNFKNTLFWLHQKRELEKYAQYFDTIEAHPLTELQRRSVILNERRNLVVAGAGTGKTSVIIAKAGYLLKSKKCQPEDILLLAFNKPAANELEERCLEKLNANIKSKTFHSLGKEIIDEVEGKKNLVSKLATDEGKFDNFLKSFIVNLRKDPEVWKEFKSFIIGKAKPYKSEHEFKTLLEYKSYVRSVELRALSGDLVKSFGELDIANFLFMKGVKFQYEPRYKKTTVKYQPDFYLPEHDLYLEHFGIDREGQTAPYINGKIYRKQMEWKRKLHQEKGTKLLETYSWQRFEGTLLQDLNHLLKSEGVAYSPISEDDIFKALVNSNYTNQIANLLKVFLTHFKSNQMNIAELRKSSGLVSDAARAEKFIELFSLFFERYQKELSKNKGSIDFNDMISKSTQYILKGDYKPSWKYIIVDEFQDISVDRYKLLEAMLKSDDEFQFFAVGDDWQSINRFAGSDISIMGKFRSFFGRSTIVNLDRTFRFNNKIADVSGQFIQKNPHQLKKNLVTHIHEAEPQVHLHPGKSSKGLDRALKPILKSIAQENNIDGDSLLVLARYNHLINDKKLKETLEKHWPGKVLEPLSVHRSKGKEADYVIVLGMDSSQFGFPSEISDDPLLSLVLAEPDDYPHAEERRLFYVAITRAKKQTHLVYDPKNPSVFVTELIDEDYDVKSPIAETGSNEACPECKSGQIINNGGNFYACLNFPYCHYEAPICETCDEEHLVAPQASSPAHKFKCAKNDCDGEALSCPKCEIGALINKTGKYGDFLGCHMWPGCSYSKK